MADAPRPGDCRKNNPKKNDIERREDEPVKTRAPKPHFDPRTNGRNERGNLLHQPKVRIKPGDHYVRAILDHCPNENSDN